MPKKTNPGSRLFRGVKTKCRPDGYETRKQEGEERNLRWAALTPRQRIEALDKRLGPGVGAKRQREKLVALLFRE